MKISDRNMSTRKSALKYGLVFILYLASYGLNLVNDGIYWDDWTLYGKSKGIILDTFSQSGLPWIGYFHAWMLSLPKPILAYRLLVFLLYLFSAVLL